MVLTVMHVLEARSCQACLHPKELIRLKLRWVMNRNIPMATLLSGASSHVLLLIPYIIAIFGHNDQCQLAEMSYHKCGRQEKHVTTTLIVQLIVI